MLLTDELRSYKTTFDDFCNYIEKEVKVDPVVFISKANNANVVPHLLNYLEYNGIDILDAIFYVHAHVKETISYNELVKKTIRTVFFMLENERPLDFLPF